MVQIFHGIFLLDFRQQPPGLLANHFSSVLRGAVVTVGGSRVGKVCGAIATLMDSGNRWEDMNIAEMNGIIHQKKITDFLSVKLVFYTKFW